MTESRQHFFMRVNLSSTIIIKLNSTFERSGFIVILFMLSFVLGMSQTSLQGTVSDEETKEPILFCNVVLYKNDVLIKGAETDLDGNYSFYNIDPGTYDLEVSYVGFNPQRVRGIVVFAGKTNKVDIELTQGLVLTEVVVSDYKIPLVEQDNTTSGGIVTGEQIRNLPTKSINKLAASTAGISSIDGESVAIRGSRTNATDYYVDGIRVSSASLIPQSEIDQLQVITGGVEARYGDVTGGVISITTKGPSNTLQGGIELESSKYLDPFGRSEANMYLSGPILKTKSGRSVLGYRVSGRFLYIDDDGPGVVPSYRASDETIAKLEADPVRFFSGTAFPSAEFLHDNDIEQLDAVGNEDFRSIDLVGKLDARISPSIDFSISGSYRDSKDKFPGSGALPGGWSLFNYKNNPISDNNSYRVNGRFRHQINTGTGENASFFQNITYTLQGGYEKLKGISQDSRHRDNLFRYGHIGTFDFSWDPVEGEMEEYSGNILGLAHAGFLRNLNEPFSASTFNPVLANYNKGINQTVFESYVAYNGFVSNSFNNAWGFYSNVGNVYNRFTKADSDRLTFNAYSSFDIVPRSGGRHSIEFGISHEQIHSRSWGVAPFGLWEVARLQANRHIIGVDTTEIVGSFPGVVTPQVTYEEFAKLIVENDDLRFYKAVRDLTGTSIKEYINVDGIDPDQLSLDMFSVLELTDQRIVSFSGYDYLGNKRTDNPSFLDFFSSRGADGRRDFPIASFQPMYQAAYIQDKFAFKDIIFRVGLRVDRFDANTYVLKDPLSLYPIMDASDFYERFGGNRPATVEDDYQVYVTGANSNEVKAYRKGEQWYLANGTAANDGNVIFGGEIVYPKYYEEDVNNVKSEDFDPLQSFEKYKPQLSWMPRLAVSFPISDIANFFAHYDVLVQRPPSSNNATPFDWYYFEDDQFTAGNPFPNSNLRPERTIDYEVGFQQKLSNSSALKINAYYKELRDMLQQKSYLYLPSPITTYVTYGNSDFGTVKGFSFQYDLRRTDNISAQLNYTLQFADGTGSNVNSQAGLTTRGNLRTLFPLDRDERHSFKATLDYRFGRGPTYNGPVLFGKQILANAGLNIQSFMVSGRPYTRTIRSQPFGGTGFFGSINGARKPWTFTLDARVDKSFLLNGLFPNKPLFLNVSLRMLNVLNLKNVANVYSASGSPYDSGFLLSSDGEATLENVRSTGETVLEAGRDEQAYIDAFYWAVTSSGNFYSPRRIFLGLRIDF